MQRNIWKGVFVAVASASALAIAAWAQLDEISACADACYEAEEICYEKCPDAADQAACEDQCQQQAESCLAKCD